MRQEKGKTDKVIAAKTLLLAHGRRNSSDADSKYAMRESRRMRNNIAVQRMKKWR
jgi:hypothetical protein